MRPAKAVATSAAVTNEPHERGEEKPPTCPSVTPKRKRPAASASRRPPGRSKEESLLSENVSGKTRSERKGTQ
jgi:hypothetical protein